MDTDLTFAELFAQVYPDEPWTFTLDDLERLRLAWDFDSPSAGFLKKMIDLAWALEPGRSVLECGAGLGTVILSTIANESGEKMATLEDDEVHYQTTKQVLWQLRTNRSLDLFRFPIRRYQERGNYDWYDCDEVKRLLVSDIGLVIALGPLGLGQRYGVLPRMRDHMAPGCLLLLPPLREDDSHTAQIWQAERLAKPVVVTQQYTVLEVV